MLSRDSTRDPLVNRVFKNTYRLTGILTSGGMGMIYRAEHLRLRVPLAVKVLRRDLPDPEKLVERLRREARLQAMVRHPGAVKILDLDETNDGVVFIVMELCPGRALSRIVDAEAPLSVARAVDLTTQILEILDAAHEAQIVHSDLKPENILVETRQDGTERVRILDFGVATLLEDTEDVRADRQGRDDVWGSPSYTAPEQALGRPVDPRADLYSVGVLLYEMLTGALPIDDPDLDRFYEKLVNEPHTPITTHRTDLHPGLQQVVRRALAKLPADRPANASEFRAGLAAPDPRSTRTRRFLYGVLLVLVFVFGALAGRAL